MVVLVACVVVVSVVGAFGKVVVLVSAAVVVVAWVLPGRLLVEVELVAAGDVVEQAERKTTMVMSVRMYIRVLVVDVHL